MGEKTFEQKKQGALEATNDLARKMAEDSHAKEFLDLLAKEIEASESSKDVRSLIDSLIIERGRRSIEHREKLTTVHKSPDVNVYSGHLVDEKMMAFLFTTQSETDPEFKAGHYTGVILLNDSPEAMREVAVMFLTAANEMEALQKGTQDEN